MSCTGTVGQNLVANKAAAIAAAFLYPCPRLKSSADYFSCYTDRLSAVNLYMATTKFLQLLFL
ncbi:hypothetical protein D0C16_13740 [Cellvibrio sp. KY-GH-1]|nr:hypothetical protein D0C16_13740 [Cellvibrio sp. KY-GH-1]